MRYVVTHGKDAIEVDVTPRDDGRYDVRIAGRAAVADLASSGGRSLFTLLLDAESHELSVVRGEERTRVTLDGHDLGFVVESEQQRNARLVESPGASVGPQTVKSIMPGRVVRILVQEAEVVESGTPLLILEAMKMENEIRSASAGRVAKLLVREGQTVGNGEPLVTLE